MRKIGILGGSFNPIHMAHLILAERACEALSLDKVIFVPAKLPPHKDPSTLASAADRLAMVRLAIRGNRRFAASDIELRRAGPSYTLHTIQAVRERFGRSAEIFFLIGADTLPELPTWYEVRRLVKLCKFVPLSRPGARPIRTDRLASALGATAAHGILARRIEMPLLDISSSDIRRRIRQGRSIRYLVPDPVFLCIREKRLYLRSEDVRC